MKKSRTPNNPFGRFQGWLAFLTSVVLLGLLLTGFIIAVIRLTQWVVKLMGKQIA